MFKGQRFSGKQIILSAGWMAEEWTGQCKISDWVGSCGCQGDPTVYELTD